MNNNYYRKIYNIFICMGFCILFVITAFPMTAYADYGSWIDKDSDVYKKIYGSVETEDFVDQKAEEPKPFEQMLADLVISVGDAIYNFMSSGNIKLTLDSIVTGRMGEGVDVTFTLFDLNDGNPYGIIGSTLYVTFRRVVQILYILVFVIMLSIQLFKNSSTGRNELKDLIKNMLFFFFLLYAMPLMVDLFIYLRDVILYEVMIDLGKLSSSLQETPISGSMHIVEQLKASFTGSRTIFNSFLYVASVFAGFFFFVQYIGIALLVMSLYAAFPFVCLISIKNKKLFENWRSYFFPNLFIPLIDGTLLLVPALIYNVYIYLFDASNDVYAVVVYVIELIAIWSIIPTRNEILRFFGYIGVRMTKPGISGAGLMLAAKMMKGGKTDPDNEANDNKKEDNAHTNTQKAEDQQKLNDIMNKADQELQLSELSDHLDREDELSNNPYESETDELLNEMNSGSPFSESGESERLGNDDSDMMDEQLSNDNIMESSLSEMDDNATMNIKMPLDNISTESGSTGSEDEQEYTVKDDDPGEAMESEDLEEPINRRNQLNQDSHMAAKSSANDEAVMETDKSTDFNSIQVPSYNYDYDFKDSLSERDQKRYENLAQKDALSSVIAKNDQLLDNMEYQRGKYTENKQRFLSDNRSLDRQIEKNSELKDSSSASVKITQLNNQKAENQRQLETLERGHEIEKQNNFYQAHMKNCDTKESAYARNSGLGGMSTRAYGSASEFKRQKEVEQVHSKHANFKNFDSRTFEGMLSPLEKEEFYRQRARDNIRKQSIHTATAIGKVVAGGTGMILGAAAGTYGGAKTMTNAAVGGTIIGSGISQTAGRAVERMTDKTGMKDEKLNSKKKKPEGAPERYPGNANNPKRGRNPENNARTKPESKQRKQKQETEQSRTEKIINDFNEKADRFEAGSKT